MSRVSSKIAVRGGQRFIAAAPKLRPAGRHVLQVPHAAAPLAETAASTELVDVIKQAVKDPRSVPGPKILQSMLALEKEKLDPKDWEGIITTKGAHWRLMLLAGKASVTAAMKGNKEKGIYYCPIAAVQNYDAAAKDFENGIFISNIGYFTVSGPFFFEGRLSIFDVTKVTVGLGPWSYTFIVKPNSPLSSLPEDPKEAGAAAKKAKLPFFTYIYVDEELVVGRGRSGGLAVWAKADTTWEAENGTLRVYGDK